MSTPHNKAELGAIAKTVLMPGDPLRAKFIAENWLTSPVLFNDVRNMFGYTGTYKGKEISVMGSGMGMPSIGIYSYELFHHYQVDNIIRVGSAGSYCEELKLFDVVLVDSAYSETAFALTQNGCKDDVMYASEKLNQTIRDTAKELGKKITEGRIHSSDVFYQEGDSYFEALYQQKKCLAVEMESFALFHNANVLKKQAACLLTISDSFVSDEVATTEERQKSFTDMIDLALECAVKF